jgi:ribosome-associated protein
MEIIKIKTPFIKLDQLLKYSGLVDSGGDAKDIILSGLIKLNDVVVLERGKKIYPGDCVEMENGDKISLLKVE